jgi:hypothetical protein
MALTATPSQLSPGEHAVIARVVDDAPPLSQSAKARLAALLRGAHTRPDHFASKLAKTMRGDAA